MVSFWFLVFSLIIWERPEQFSWSTSGQYQTVKVFPESSSQLKNHLEVSTQSSIFRNENTSQLFLQIPKRNTSSTRMTNVRERLNLYTSLYGNMILMENPNLEQIIVQLTCDHSVQLFAINYTNPENHFYPEIVIPNNYHK